MLKKNKTVSNFDVLPTEIIFEIMQFLTSKPLFSFILSCKEVYNVFKSFSLVSLNKIRLKYLNNEASINQFRRLIQVFRNKYQFPKIISCKNEQQLKQRMFIHSRSKINKILLEEIFHFNENYQQQFIIAGGFVLFCLTEKAKFDDIDVFLCENGCSIDDTNEIFQKFLISIDRKLSSCDMILVKNASTLNIFSENAPPLQFVFRRIPSLEYLLCFFDIDAARFGFDGKVCYTIYEGIRSLHIKKNICEKQHISKKLYFRRAIKYNHKGFETIFFNAHPLMNYFSFNVISKILPLSSNYYNERYDSQDNALFVDIGLYTPFLTNVSFKEYKELYSLGFDGFFEKHKDKDVDDYYEDYEENNYQFPLKGRLMQMREAFEKEKYYFCKSFKELFSMDVSYCFTEGYFDSHLFKKYDFTKCYLCGNYRKITYKLFLDNEAIGDYTRQFEDDQKKFNKPFCEKCSKFNESKKLLKRDLNNFVAIVTGGRIKIGFETCLLLLRNNCYVISTTRFPGDALKRFKRIKDYEKFKNKLEIYPLDLRKVGQVNEFCKYIKKKFKRINILVNNAAQTIFYPIFYYRFLIKDEIEDLCTKARERSRNQKEKIDKSVVLFRNFGVGIMEEFVTSNQLQVLSKLQDENLIKRAKTLSVSFENVNEIDLDVKIVEKHKKNFPNEKNEFGEPVDKRKKTSWTIKPTEIKQSELLEAQMINSIAPSIIIQNLYDVMKTTATDFQIGYIINVTSVEGSFNTIDFNTDDHVHTNMSKSALNQYTKSAAKFFAKAGVLMNSVDTGWISSYKTGWKKPPLSTKDGAFRIMFPIFSKTSFYGKLFKNYKVVPW